MASIDKRPNGKYRARWREFPGGPQKSRQFVRKVDAEQFLSMCSTASFRAHTWHRRQAA